MTNFDFKDFESVFKEEVKINYNRFISENKEKLPYIFVITANDYIVMDTPECLNFCGNTMSELTQNEISTDSDIYYLPEEWTDTYFSENSFPKANTLIFEFMTQNEKLFADENHFYTKDFLSFRKELFYQIVDTLESLKNEQFYSECYNGKMLINFYVRDYFEDEEMYEIFERLNSKEDGVKFREFM